MDTPTDRLDALTNLAGLKILGRIQPLFAHLRDQGCGRDQAGNRTLHLDQLAGLVMLALFNPVARSLRALSQASDLAHVRGRFGVEHASLGSLSEAARLFDPEALTGVIAELASRALGAQKDPRLAALKNPLTAVDGTLLKALPQIAQAAWAPTKDGHARHAWRLHVQFDVERSVPARFELTGPSNSGDSDEKAVLGKSVGPGRTYVMDRWFGQFTLFNAIVEAKSDYVCRVRDNSRFEVVEARPLTDGAIAAGVVSDSVVKLGQSAAAALRPDHPTRLVVVRATPHEKRGGRERETAGPSCSGELLIATSLIDVPAEIIGLIDRYRWTVEIFFRFLKRTPGCGHLSWEHPRGIKLEMYRAMIAYLLINQATGSKPTRRTYEMPCYYFLGLASPEEMTTHLSQLAGRTPTPPTV